MLRIFIYECSLVERTFCEHNSYSHRPSHWRTVSHHGPFYTDADLHMFTCDPFNAIWERPERTRQPTNTRNPNYPRSTGCAGGVGRLVGANIRLIARYRIKDVCSLVAITVLANHRYRTVALAPMSEIQGM